jgi:hypothetical protein
MLETRAVREPRADATSGAGPEPARRRQRRALAAFVVIVVLAHAAFLGGVDPLAGADRRADPAAAMSVRTLAAEPALPPAPAAEAVESVPAVEMRSADARPAAPAPARPARRPRVATLTGPSTTASSAPIVQASASSPVVEIAIALVQIDANGATGGAGTSLVGSPPEPPPPASVVAEAETERAPPPAREPSAASAPAAGGVAAPPSSSPSLLAAGEKPPPTYRTRLPPAQTLRYEVRSGFLRGTGELRWRREGDGYSLDLEARIAGLTLLRQTSEGGVDASGLAPVRFVDQRARRPRQAANFRRDAGTITFSGPSQEWPLLAGSQDRLSLFIQLAGVAAANPALVVEGSLISMVVVGARGDASVWTFRCAGPERIETGLGPVQALKFIREPRSEHDTRAEMWLDPEHHFLPAHATLRNAAGASEYDLLLQGIDPTP